MTNFGYDEHSWRGAFNFNEGRLGVIDHAHREIHKGRSYHAAHLWAAIADDATAQVLVSTSGYECHMVPQASVGGDFFAYIYEGTVVTGASGTAVTAFCQNRQAPIAASAQVFHGPEGISATGTAIVPGQLLAGGGGPKSPGGAAQSRSEWIFSANQNYLIRFVNKAGGTKAASVTLEWYED